MKSHNLDSNVNVCCDRESGMNTHRVFMCIHSLTCFYENIHTQEQSDDSKKEVNTARRKTSCERECVWGPGKAPEDL